MTVRAVRVREDVRLDEYRVPADRVLEVAAEAHPDGEAFALHALAEQRSLSVERPCLACIPAQRRV